MRYRGCLPEEERVRLARLMQLLGQGEGMLRASLYEMRRRCGTSGCHCARGELHRSLYLCHSRQGKRRSRCVPPEKEAQVRVWVQRYKQARQLLDEIAQLYWERLGQSGR